MKNCARYPWLALSCAAMSLAAIAQDDSDKNYLEEITVYGKNYADSLKKSLNAKQNSALISEALSADGLGQLPEISVSEALGRLPGVTVVREVAGAGAVNIRGMGAVLTNGTFNGRDIASTYGDRAVPYTLGPPELKPRAAVYKAPSASGIEGGIAGTVDLRTVRPLSVRSRDVAVNLRVRHNDFANDLPGAEPDGYRGSATYIDQFAGDALGIALGYAGQDAPFVSGESSVFNSRKVAFGGRINGMPGGNGADDNHNFPYGADNGISSGASRRHALMAVLQYRPSDSVDVNIDAFYTDFASLGENAGLQAQGYGSFGNDWSDVDSDKVNLFSGTATCNRPANECSSSWGQDLRAFNAIDRSESMLSTVGVETVWSNERWSVSGNLAHSKAEASNFFASVDFRPYTGSGATRERALAVSSFGENERGAAFVVSPLNFANAATNRIDSYRIFTDDDLEDEVTVFKGDVNRFLYTEFLTRASFGVRFTDRENTSTVRRALKRLTAADSIGITPDRARGSFSLQNAHTDFDTNRVLLLNTQAIINDYFADVSSLADPIASATIGETIAAAYLQFDFEKDFGNTRVSGNFGVRYVDTAVKTSGARRLEGVLAPINTNDKHTHTLPSLNVNVSPSDGVIVRLGLATAISLAPLSFLSPGTEQQGDRIFGGAGGGGNPYLRPYVADQADLAFEKYFSEDTAFTIALFYKDLDTFIANLEIPGPNNSSAFVPANGRGGHIRGAELLWQQQFTGLLPERMGELGIYLNYSYTESNVRLTETFDSGSYGLDGLSNNVANITLHWSGQRWGARVAYRFRDDFTRPQRPARAFTTNRAEGDLSFQIRYDPTESISIVLQGWNLTNEARDSYYGLERLQGQYRVFGRNLELGFTYRLK